MKNQWIRIVAVATVAVGLALAQGPGGPRTRGPGQAGPQEGRDSRHFEFLSTYLELTESQKQQAQSIFEASNQASQALREPSRQARQALNEAVKANKSDAEIDQLAAAWAALVGQTTAIQAKSQAKFNALLTPEQREKLDKMPGPRGPMGFSDAPFSGPIGPRGGPPSRR